MIADVAIPEIPGSEVFDPNRKCLLGIMSRRYMTGGLSWQMISWFKIACRTSAWTLAFPIVILSLVPPSYRPVTEAPHSFEHLAIFLATGLAFGAGYPGRPFPIAVTLVMFSGAVELLQQ